MQTHNLLGRRVAELHDSRVTGTVVAVFLDDGSDVQLLVEYDGSECFNQGDTGLVEALAMRLLPADQQGPATSDDLDDLEVFDDDNWSYEANTESALELHCELNHVTQDDVLRIEPSDRPGSVFIGIDETSRAGAAGIVLRAPSARKLARWILANTPAAE